MSVLFHLLEESYLLAWTIRYSLVDQWLEIACPYVDQANLTFTCNEYEWELLAVEVRERSHEELLGVTLIGVINPMKDFVGFKHQ